MNKQEQYGDEIYSWLTVYELNNFPDDPDKNLCLEQMISMISYLCSRKQRHEGYPTSHLRPQDNPSGGVYPHFWDPVLVDSNSTWIFIQLDSGQPCQEILTSVIILLESIDTICQEIWWKPSTVCRLPVIEWDNTQEPLSATVRPGYSAPVETCQMLHQVRCQKHL